ncbi:MAG TPA: ferredoxin [Gammaproteobacteria bacterium]|nr:ferredoxin [Gammaproteobacteria bacterium]
MSDWQDVCGIEELKDGERRLVDLHGVAVVVVRVDGQWFAIEDVCSHDGDSLGDGPLEGDRIVCPRHGARFCLRTGAALTPPAYEPVAVFALRLADGRVQVRDDRW